MKSIVTYGGASLQEPVEVEIAKRPRPANDSVQRALEQVGDAWTFMILRELFFGVRRFADFETNTGVSPAILTDRLRKLVRFKLATRAKYSERPARYEYRLTEKGRDLYPLTVGLMLWGDRWLSGRAGPPLELLHRSCGAHAHPRFVCDVCDEPIEARTMDWRPGPGSGLASKSRGTPP